MFFLCWTFFCTRKPDWFLFPGKLAILYWNRYVWKQPFFCYVFSVQAENWRNSLRDDILSSLKEFSRFLACTENTLQKNGCFHTVKFQYKMAKITGNKTNRVFSHVYVFCGQGIIMGTKSCKRKRSKAADSFASPAKK